MMLHTSVCLLVSAICFLQQAVSLPSTLPTSGSELYHDGSSLPEFPQLMPSQITSSQKLYCSSADVSDEISWVISFPSDSVTLNSDNTMFGGVEVTSSSAAEGVTLSLSPTGANMIPLGIHKCVVNGTNGITLLPVMISDGSISPVVSQSCKRISFDPDPLKYQMTGIIGYMATTNIRCTDEAGNVVNGTINRECINGTHSMFTFDYCVPNLPYKVTCTITTAPATGFMANVSCEISQSITVPSLPTMSQFFFNGANLIGNHILTTFDINNVLWFQGNSTTAVVSVILVDGTVVSSTSTGTIGGFNVITSSPGQIGLQSTGSVPSGIYTGVINGRQIHVQIGPDIGAPKLKDGNIDCSVSGTTLTVKGNFSDGLPTDIQCSSTGDGVALPLLDVNYITLSMTTPICATLCANFDITSALMLKEVSCTFRNALGNVQDMCQISGDVDPSSTRIAPSTSAKVDLSTSKVDPSTTQVDVSASSTAPLQTTNPVAQCDPAEGYLVDVILQRKNDGSCGDCETIDKQNGFIMQSLNAVINSNSLEGNCTNPIIITKGFYCGSGEGKDKTPKKGGTPKKTPKKGTPKKGTPKKMKPKKMKGTPKMNKATAEKSRGRRYTHTRGRRNTLDDNTEVIINALVLCNGCSPFQSNTGIGRRSIRRHSIERRTKKSKATSSQVIQDMVPPMITVGGLGFNVTVNEQGIAGLFCNCNLVDEGTACDCPDTC